MGHSRIGTLPATRKWKDVILLIGSGGNEAQVADAVMEATGKTFSRVRDDAGFREAMGLILQLALAGGRVALARPQGEPLEEQRAKKVPVVVQVIFFAMLELILQVLRVAAQEAFFAE
jgi:hypothetical protein